MFSWLILRLEVRLYDWLERRLYQNPSAEAVYRHEHAPKLKPVPDDYQPKDGEEVVDYWVIGMEKPERYLVID